MNPESEMRSRGRRRWQKRRAFTERVGQVTMMPSGERDILRTLVPLVASDLKAALKDRSPGKYKVALPLLRRLPAERAAVIGLRTLVDFMARGGTVTPTLYAIGGRVEDEVRFHQFNRQAPKLVKKVQSRIKHARTQDYDMKRKRMRRAEAAAEDVRPWVEWSTKERLFVGAWLVDSIMRHSGGGVRKDYRSDGKTKVLIFVPSDDLIEQVLKRNRQYENLRPWFLPMVQPPVPWTGPKAGGYETWQTTLVKRGPFNEGEILTEESNLSCLLTAVNAVQATAWQVNRRVYEVARYMLDHQVDRADIAPFTKTPAAPKPEWLVPDWTKRDAPEWQLEAFKEWRRAQADALTKEVSRKTQILDAVFTIGVAGDFMKHERLYFPHQVDWRGRMYPMPLFLQPQARDLGRGLLRFAEGKPLGPEGGQWLMIHGANCWGVDKVPFNKRVQWVIDHAEQILATAEHPLDSFDWWWTQAEDPFQFLAFCFEFAEWVNGGGSPDYVSHLPVSVDGSCNGLQHFSAMLRDSRGGAAVNLTPSERPQDVYAQVAEVVHRKVTEVQTEKLAREWLASGLLDRKIVKRQVMTLPYGVSMIGARTQLRDHLTTMRDLPFEEGAWPAAYWLAPLIWGSIGDVIVAAPTAMKYMHEVARVCLKAEVPLRWTTPHGLVIEQRYTLKKSSLIKTQLLGSVRLTVLTPTPRIDRREQVNGVAPNFVHSIDAAHLCRTVEWMEKLGGFSYQMVHDCYGTHACDVPLLNEVLRVTFVEIHRDDVLGEVRMELADRLPAGTEAPAPPPQGSLDLNEVLKSPYFFA